MYFWNFVVITVLIAVLLFLAIIYGLYRSTKYDKWIVLYLSVPLLPLYEISLIILDIYFRIFNYMYLWYNYY